MSIRHVAGHVTSHVTWAAAAALVAGTLISGSVSAMPLGNIKAAADTLQNTENVRWVCGPYRCWWRPGPHYWGGPRAYWGPRPYYRHYGFYGPRYGFY